MTLTAEDLIRAKGAHSEAVEQAARFCLSEMTGDKILDDA